MRRQCLSIALTALHCEASKGSPSREETEVQEGFLGSFAHTMHHSQSSFLQESLQDESFSHAFRACDVLIRLP